jgi:hypothetical protein
MLLRIHNLQLSTIPRAFRSPYAIRINVRSAEEGIGGRRGKDMNTHQDNEKIMKYLLPFYIDKIKDENLKRDLIEYLRNPSPFNLYKVLSQFYTYDEPQIVNRLFPMIKLTKIGLILGGIIWDNLIEIYVLRVHDNFIVLEWFDVQFDFPPIEENQKVIRIAKIENIYKCECGNTAFKFENFVKHFLRHDDDLEKRIHQLMDEMRILDEEAKWSE